MKHTAKRIALRALCVLLLLCMIIPASVSCSKKAVDEDNFLAEYSDEKTNFVVLEVKFTNQNGKKETGKIVIQLFPDEAPITVANFQQLVADGFYDGLTFHRVVSGFMIQGGDPKGNGTGGSSNKIKGEFTSNGVDNKISHKRGVISMARSDNMNSASSQFFIMHADNEQLDGSYAAFGKVIYGMETVDAITKTAIKYNSTSGEASAPINPVVIKSAKFVTVPTEYTTTADTVYTTIGGNTGNNGDNDSANKPDNFDTAPKNDDLDFTDINIEDYENSDTVSDYVRLNISYTDASGQAQTGDVVIRLFADVAPKTVENFKNLVRDGFYDGLTFHRVYKNFMIQGGDPKGNGTGGSADMIQGEFTSNGFQNNLSHKRGVVSMARAKAYNSASSQFFIMHADYTGLDGDYASFGYVVYGMDTVDGIANTAVQYNSSYEKTSPINPVTINYATFMSAKA